MRYQTLFRVLLKAIGVLLIAQSLPYAVSHSLSLLMRLAADAAGSGGFIGNDWYQLPYIAGYVLMTGIGLYLFFGGKYVADLALPDNRLYCAECGYQLSSRDGAKCPECGAGTGDPQMQGTV